MFTPPHAFSRSIVGPAILLLAVMTAYDELIAASAAKEKLIARMTVYRTEGTDTEVDCRVEDVAAGNHQGHHIMLDGIPIADHAALDAIMAAQGAAEAAGARMALPWVNPKNGRTYGGQSLIELRAELMRKIKAVGLEPMKVLAEHGYRHPYSS